jgi:molybdenum cofactor synthesis domain-containing protein
VTVEVEIICIGNELLIGKVQNTNAHWLATQVTSLGANVKRVTVIQDVIDEIAKTINEAVARNPQFIITTGGLGPTFDDKTFQGVAKALNQKLAVNQQALEMVKAKTIEYLKKRQMPIEIEMTPPRVKMATMPETTEPVTNPIGSAPGLQAIIDGVVLFALPGVPREMEAIFTQTIAPLIKAAVGRGVFCERSIFVDDFFESRLAPIIDQVMGDCPGVYIKSHPLPSEGKSHVELHLTIMADQEQNPAEALRKAEKQLTALIEANGGLVHF